MPSANEVMPIVVTDSGLGGLSVAADLCARLQRASPWPRVRILFFNCRPRVGGGFNVMASDARRVRVFNRVLECSQQRFDPQVILVACNTLSVLLDRTDFVRARRRPTLSVVEAGVGQVAERMREHPGETVLLFGTGTTIRSGAHKTALVQQGFPAGQLLYQDCDRLETAIEYHPGGGEAEVLMRTFAAQALQRLPPGSAPLSAALLCTHYGYAQPLWERVLKELSGHPVPVMNPNTRMVDAFLAAAPPPAGPAQVSMQVVGQTEISRTQKDAVGRLLRPVCPLSADALENDACISHMFSDA